MKKLLVLGVGNILMMDEGIGVHAVHEFWKEKESSDGIPIDYAQVDFIDGGTFTQDLFYLFEQYQQILVLDVVRAYHPPGTIYSLDEDDLVKNQKQVLSLHDIDLLDSLSMARMRGHSPLLKIIGIEPEKIDWGTELTPTIAKVFPSFMNVARKHIHKLLT